MAIRCKRRPSSRRRTKPDPLTEPGPRHLEEKQKKIFFLKELPNKKKLLTQKAKLFGGKVNGRKINVGKW